MELVNGVPIVDYCDQQHLTPRERLALFVPVCQAVQHAHQKGIIHRDLKPSNILVALYDSQPVPKVIDFGVAKATSQSLTEKTLFTQLGQIVGTLEYMSPEQAQRNQLDIDTRSDIYSLGVVLYELLTGATPFERARLRSAAYDEILRIIREEDPPRPSMRLSTIETLPSVAANRRIEPQKLRRLLEGELDWIVMKSLEKDRARRYETANGLAADIQHYLNDEPVVACPPSKAYQLRKLARRHKAALWTMMLVAAAVFFGLIGTSWQAMIATLERNRAEQAEVRALREAELKAGEAERADRAARRLELQLRIANATRLAAQSAAVREEFPSQSMLLAVEAVETTWRHDKSIVPAAHETLLNRVAFVGGQAMTGHFDAVAETILSSDGHWYVAGHDDGAVVVWDMTGRDPSWTGTVLRGHTERVNTLAISARRSQKLGPPCSRPHSWAPRTRWAPILCRIPGDERG